MKTLTPIKHTPGPWRVGGHPRDNSGTAWHEILTDADEFGPSYVCQAMEQDARLIAAAPDLLAALRMAVARIEVANAEGNPILSAWLADARAAIARAEGGDS
jgi:hypothetical protein